MVHLVCPSVAWWPLLCRSGQGEAGAQHRLGAVVGRSAAGACVVDVHGVVSPSSPSELAGAKNMVH